jgi:diacylglycerol kinase family enzyme
MGSGCRLRIEAEDSELNDAIPFQLDGDPGGVLPLEIEVLPGRLTLIIPTNCRIRKQSAAVPAQLAHQP